ncbi:MAG: Mur ligase family protein [Planctomycetota bacterium]|jgi:UDP-N-acetylmuramyl tripeptide synthase|nr:Mur ligase family protein [Planctomycetota bacterium]
MKQVDSRRLPGPNLLWIRPGAVIDVSVFPDQSPALVCAWERQARCILDAVGWVDEKTRVRTFSGGASFAISAPLDALYAATEVNEWAFETAIAGLAGEPVEDSSAAAERLRRTISEEVNPRLIALRQAALSRDVDFLSDDDRVSVGLGTGSLTWDVDALPTPSEVDWTARHAVPTALVTGTNGKTTTVRLLSAIAQAAGKIPGLSSTDQVQVGEEVVDAGDWSGPGGARLVLRDQRVEVAVLETARGGMLRRGLALERADVAAVLNVGADHLGEWGVGSLEGLCRGKFVVTTVAPLVVLNADDEAVSCAGRALERDSGKRVVWFTLGSGPDWLADHLSAGGRAYRFDGDRLLRCEGDREQALVSASEIPIAAGGAARHNVANALAAAAVAEALGLDEESVVRGLTGFQADDTDNPGRMNRFDLSGVDVIVDFAHNPHGMNAILEMASALPAKRRLVLLGQAGDRDDESIRELARSTWAARPDRIILKDLTVHRRGREEGEVIELLAAELQSCGAPPESWTTAPGEMEAVEDALNWSQSGDLLILLAHDSPRRVLERVRDLKTQGWAPGDPLPPRG